LGNYELLLKLIIEGLLEKKAKEIVNIDLRKLEYAACDNFIVCHGDSGTQVKALAGSVEDKVEESLRISVKHREGLENASWILLDYGEIVIHIFVKKARDYYKLEDLWGDADITLVKDE
jgi:ribosome-associated protein